MGLFDRFRTDPAAYVAAYRDASGLENPSVGIASALSAFDDGSPSASGISVSPERALRSIAVYACIRVLAESVASLPAHVYRRDGRSRVRVEDDPRERLLSDEPNPFQTAETFWSTLMAHALSHGNGYALVERDSRNRPAALWLLDPRTTAPTRRRSDGALFFGSYVTGVGTVSYDSRDVIHLRGTGLGDVGISPIGVARQAIGESLAAEEYAGKFFTNSALPGGIIKYARKISDADHREFSRRWAAMHQGARRSHFVAVLDNGADFEPLSVNAKDAQFLELRQFGVRSIARLYRVPPHMVGDLEGTVTHASIEQQAIDFVVHSLRPWIVRLEQALGRAMFSSRADRRDEVYARFNVDALLRGDTKSRYEAYALAIQNGWYSVNDVRAFEDQPAIADGDTYVQPLNLGPLNALGKLPKTSG
jgi:HK97 family phage portal protein